MIPQEPGAFAAAPSFGAMVFILSRSVDRSCLLPSLFVDARHYLA
jgi:hypothetical protein